MRSLRPSLELTAWLIGAALFGAYGVSAYWSSYARDKGIEEFTRLQQDYALANAEPASSPANVESVPERAIDMSTWSTSRIQAYRKHAPPPGAPEALLRIPSIDLVVPVFPGTGATSLDRGAGRIEGTPRFGDWGNTGIAAHRDGFFRGLQHVRRGDLIRLELPYVTYSYKVVSIRIVDPSETSVLNDSPEPMITLVTCYPFYFVGPAPKRFIVHAIRMQEGDIRLAQPTATPRKSLPPHKSLGWARF